MLMLLIVFRCSLITMLVCMTGMIKIIVLCVEQFCWERSKELFSVVCMHIYMCVCVRVCVYSEVQCSDMSQALRSSG